MNGLFVGEEGETLCVLNLAIYLWAYKTKANAITSEEFTKALNGAKKATLPDQYKNYINIFCKEGFNSLLEK